jgi:hypothetical protein
MESIETKWTGADRPPAIPLDLNEWATPAQLRAWVKESTGTLDWDNPELLERLRLDPGFEPRAILETLTLAYATSVFHSEDVARACSRDANFRDLRPNLPVEAAEFSLFRKVNRALLKATLAHVLTTALKRQFIEAETIGRLPAGLRRLVIENTVERLDIARHMDRLAEV